MQLLPRDICELVNLVAEPVLQDHGVALVRRAGEWDEVLLVAAVNTGEWIGCTTSADATEFKWTVIRFNIGAFRLVAGRGVDRMPPPGLGSHAINWIMDPSDPYLATKWAPEPAQLMALAAERQAIGDLVRADANAVQWFGAGGDGLPEINRRPVSRCWGSATEGLWQEPAPPPPPPRRNPPGRSWSN